MFVQNDTSVYWQDASTNQQDGQTDQSKLAEMLASFTDDTPCEEVLDAFRSSKGQDAANALNLLLLEDVILYVAEEELEPLVEELCCLTGATKVDSVTPCLTTHIVCTRDTPMLRSMIASIHAKVTSGATSAKAALTTERSHLDLVTPNWLKSSLIKQKQQPVGLFRPEKVRKTTETMMAGMKAQANARGGL